MYPVTYENKLWVVNPFSLSQKKYIYLSLKISAVNFFGSVDKSWKAKYNEAQHGFRSVTCKVDIVSHYKVPELRPELGYRDLPPLPAT